VNGSFTAVECVDRLGQAFGRLAARTFPSPARSEPNGRLRVVAVRPTFPQLLDVALDPIRHHSRESAFVLSRVLDALAGLADRATKSADREAVRGHVDRVLRAAAGLPEADDREPIRARGEALRAALLMPRPTATPQSD